ncbi:hypothetical protein LIPSTDRAFT_312114 [Lipomyces starkeyi NRRL Y-11557]|uniref:Uncharacterized protein n=1 Tax=Lipomyces starkeyi NRRL Y-11557 TaxID=675824 RepID=A0A1E3Q2T4_LIPST|nr:hypothetical protein LIPSTDRAFT_312114 [Lipomyces starkeyi NRRL Y-11557]
MSYYQNHSQVCIHFYSHSHPIKIRALTSSSPSTHSRLIATPNNSSNKATVLHSISRALTTLRSSPRPLLFSNRLRKEMMTAAPHFLLGYVAAVPLRGAPTAS